MRVQIDVTDITDASTVTEQRSFGTLIHGLFMEGARWDIEENSIADSKPKDLYPTMPVLHIIGVTVDKFDSSGRYDCPIFSTTIHGPTFIFSGPLKTKDPPYKWVLAGVTMVCQPD